MVEKGVRAGYHPHRLNGRAGIIRQGLPLAPALISRSRPTPMPSSELPKLANALERIERGDASGYEREDVEWGRVKRYEFGTFSVMTKA